MDSWLGVGSSSGKESPLPAKSSGGAGIGGSINDATFTQILRCAERQNEPTTSSVGAHSLNALRAAAAERHSCGELSVTLASFEPKFSPRNFIVLGRPTSYSHQNRSGVQAGQVA